METVHCFLSFAVTISRPPGTQTIDASSIRACWKHTLSSIVRIVNSGSFVCGQAVQDYVPFQTASLSLWTDFGDIAGSQIRGDAVAFRPRPAQYATGVGSLSNSGGFVVQSDQLYVLQRQNGRNVL